MKTHRTLLLGGLLASASTMLFTGKVIVAKMMYLEGIGPTGTLALRMAFALPFFVAPALRDAWNPETRVRAGDVALACLTGLLGYYCASFLDFFGIRYISTALERMILNTYPSVVMLAGALLLGRRLDARLGVAMLVGYTGIALMLHEEFALMTGPGDRPLLGAALIFTSVVVYSSSVLLAERVMGRIGSRRFTSIAMGAASVGVLVHYCAQYGLTPPSRDPDVVAMGAVLGVFSTVLPVYIYNRALQMVGAQRVGLLGFPGVAATFGISALLLGEPFSLAKVLGICIAAGGALLVVTGRDKPSAALPKAQPRTARA